VRTITLAVAVVSFLSCIQLNAQDQHCYTSEVYHKRIQEHPELLRVQSELENYTQQASSRLASVNHITGVVYVIPIVFHIIHNYGSENISDAQVMDEVRILNDDYRKRSYDTASIVPPFKPIAADCEIEFRLATIDPAGNCTNGIEHIASPLTNMADDNSKLDPWPENEYLNVWVVSSLAWSGAAAYAYYPGTAPNGADGVIMLSGYVGSIGSSSLGLSRVLTHEIGHYLNLEHVWGNSNNPGVACGDDNVFDTPETMGWTTCNINGATCGNAIDNVQNYMEYSYCCKMFTEGQKTRMRAALTSPVGGRDNLWTPSNLTATGTAGSAPQVCVPVADFSANHLMVCAGSQVRFKDLSWNGIPSFWSWSFPGGTPASSNDSMPVVVYNAAGIYNVSLTVTNSAGSDSTTKNLYIQVNGSSARPLPFSESFETAGSFPGTDSYVINPDGGNTWQRVTNAGSTGTASIRMNNYSGNSDGETDDYITAPFDFTGIFSPVLKFRLAYAQRDTSIKDKLEVAVSVDCGQSWTLRYSKSGQSLATASATFAPFAPASSDWRQETVNILPFQNIPNVRFRFRNVSASGNNIYADDINVNGVVNGINDAAGVAGFNIYPNPASRDFTVEFSSAQLQHVSLRVHDALGREVISIVNSDLQAGKHSFRVNQKLEAGIYFISIEEPGRRFSRKLVVTE